MPDLNVDKNQQAILKAGRNLLGRIEEIGALVNCELSWDDKFDLAFEHAKKVRKLQDALGLTTRYYDPDSTYEADVRAWYDFLLTQKEEIRRAMAEAANNLLLR